MALYECKSSDLASAAWLHHPFFGFVPEGWPVASNFWEQLSQLNRAQVLLQVFAYLVVEFKTKKNHLNQVVTWSSIIQRIDDANLVSINEQIAYPYMLTDQGNYCYSSLQHCL